MTRLFSMCLGDGAEQGNVRSQGFCSCGVINREIQTRKRTWNISQIALPPVEMTLEIPKKKE